MEKKNQHYVPQFHLRQWSSNGKLISVYNKYSQRFVDNKGSIRNLASRDYFYDKNGEAEKMLGKIESSLSPLYRKIIGAKSTLDLTALEQNLLYLHFILSNERTDAAGQDYKELVKTVTQESLKLYQAHGRYMDIDADTIKEKVDVQFSCNDGINVAFKYYPLIIDLPIAVIQNTSNVEFITSDYPSIKYNYWGKVRNLKCGWGVCSIGLMFILPISPRVALIAYDPVVYTVKNLRGGVVKIKNDSDITEINRLMLLNSNQNVFFSERIPFHYINKLISPIKEYIVPQKTVQTLGSTGNLLIVNSSRKINYKATFKFLTICPDWLSLEVPMYSNLLRPTSKDIAKHLGLSIES